MVEIVVFDIGRVLVEWDPEAYYAKKIGAKRAAQFFATVPMFDQHFKSDQGENFFDVIEATAKAYPDWEAEIKLWAEDWDEITKDPISLSAEIMMALKARGIPVWGLSNFGAENFPITQAQHPVLQSFDRLFLSGELMLVKPDPAIYALVEEQADCAPESLYFIDDTPANIEAAKTRGWQTHHFKGPAFLLGDLVERGLLTAEDFQ